MAVDGVSALVKDGKIQETSASSLSLSSEKVKGGSSLDKEAFLQLLVAQMKYQDPLEPTDNTEYVSQLATFSELEEMQNLVQSTDMQRASALIGQYVSIEDTDATGNTKYAEGYVNNVVYQGNKTYVSVNDVLYNFESVKKVYDNDYIYAQKLAEAVAKAEAEGKTDNQDAGAKDETKTEDADA